MELWKGVSQYQWWLLKYHSDSRDHNFKDILLHYWRLQKSSSAHIIWFFLQKKAPNGWRCSGSLVLYRNQHQGRKESVCLVRSWNKREDLCMGSGFKQRGKCDRVFTLEVMSKEFILFEGMCLKANGVVQYRVAEQKTIYWMESLIGYFWKLILYRNPFTGLRFRETADIGLWLRCWNPCGSIANLVVYTSSCRRDPKLLVKLGRKTPLYALNRSDVVVSLLTFMEYL